jgi:hypothetical protein
MGPLTLSLRTEKVAGSSPAERATKALQTRKNKWFWSNCRE